GGPAPRRREVAGAPAPGPASRPPNPVFRVVLAQPRGVFTGKEKRMSTTAAVNLSSFDVQRLEPILARNPSAHALPDHLGMLLKKINDCIEVPPPGVPPYVVTMNSKVRLLDLDAGREMECTLVFPLKADADEGRISVLAPLGAALLGSRVGNTDRKSTRLNSSHV